MSKIRKKKLLKEIKKEEEKKLEAQKCIKKLPGETILQYLRRIIKLIKWYTLVTILIALPGSVWTGIQLYNYIFKDELKEEKELIAQQISVLENDLKPQSLPIEIDTLQDVKLIKKFQKETLDACTYWKRFESPSPYHDFINEEADRLSIYQTTAENSELLWLTMFRSLWTLGKLVRYAGENGIDGYETFDNNKILNLYILAVEHDSIRKKYLEKAEKYRITDREKTVEIIDKMKKSPDFYAFSIDYFKNIKEFHDICNLVIRNYLYTNSMIVKEEEEEGTIKELN